MVGCSFQMRYIGSFIISIRQQGQAVFEPFFVCVPTVHTLNLFLTEKVFAFVFVCLLIYITFFYIKVSGGIVILSSLDGYTHFGKMLDGC